MEGILSLIPFGQDSFQNDVKKSSRKIGNMRRIINIKAWRRQEERCGLSVGFGANPHEGLILAQRCQLRFRPTMRENERALVVYRAYILENCGRDMNI